MYAAVKCVFIIINDIEFFWFCGPVESKEVSMAAPALQQPSYLLVRTRCVI